MGRKKEKKSPALEKEGGREVMNLDGNEGGREEREEEERGDGKFSVVKGLGRFDLLFPAACQLGNEGNAIGGYKRQNQTYMKA